MYMHEKLFGDEDTKKKIAMESVTFALFDWENSFRHTLFDVQLYFNCVSKHALHHDIKISENSKIPTTMMTTTMTAASNDGNGDGYETKVKKHVPFMRI